MRGGEGRGNGDGGGGEEERRRGSREVIKRRRKSDELWESRETTRGIKESLKV